MTSNLVLTLAFTLHILVISSGLKLRSGSLKVDGRQYYEWRETDEKDSPCYLSSSTYQTLTWYDAREYCQSRGGELVSVQDKKEETLVMEMASSMGNTWFGLRREDRKQNFSWTDGSPFEIHKLNKVALNTSWDKCAVLPTRTPSNQKFWSIENCNKQNGFVCKVFKKPPIKVVTNTTKPLFPLDTDQSGWFKFEKKGHKVVELNLNYSEALDHCRTTYDAQLVTISSQSEQDYLTLLSGLYNGSDFWIGLRTMTLTTLGWVNNDRFNYTNWMKGEPGVLFGDKCVALNNDGFHVVGQWKAGFCNEKRGFVCQKEFHETNNLDILSPRLFSHCNLSSNYVQYRGQCYKVHREIKPWNLAEETCKGEGGHLVSILEPHEHSALVVYSKSQNVNDFWIGLKSTNLVYGSESNLFEWTDSKSMYLLKWATNEPSKTGKCGVQRGDGNWTMEPNCSLRKPFVCKLNQRKTNDDQRPIVKGQCPQMQGNGTEQAEEFVNVDRSTKYCYFYSDKRTSWPQAEFTCRQNAGHLASFHSEEEIKLVTPLSHASPSETAWIGLYTQLDGHLKWADETRVNYTNYGIPKAWHRKGNCVEMSLIDFKWLLSDCNEPKAFFCAVPKSEHN